MDWLAARAPQVHYSARILFQELRGQRDYRGSYDTVKNAVRPLRAEATVASLTQLRFETAPGQQAQVDWGQVQVRFASGPAAVPVFVMTLGFSRRAWVEGYPNERIGSLPAAHEHAFEHFGGCSTPLGFAGCGCGDGPHRNPHRRPMTRGQSFDWPLDATGAPGRIRTHDPLVRSQVLYPTELRARRAANYSRRPLLRESRRVARPQPAPSPPPAVNCGNVKGMPTSGGSGPGGPDPAPLPAVPARGRREPRRGDAARRPPLALCGPRRRRDVAGRPRRAARSSGSRCSSSIAARPRRGGSCWRGSAPTS